jgi:energy-converting hydrogenase A subunit R
MFEIPPEAKNFKDLSLSAQRTVQELDNIFWKVIAKMPVSKIYSDVCPMGGQQKAEAVRDIACRLSMKLGGFMYVGDSITDEEAMGLVKRRNGLAVSFNGNQYAVKNADVALLSHDGMATAVVAEMFFKLGKKATLKLLANWSRKTLEKSPLNRTFLNQFFYLHPDKLPEAKIVTEENKEEISEESSQFRKAVRGVSVGRLG